MSIYEQQFIVGLDDINKAKDIKERSILKMFEDVAGMHSESVHLGINDLEPNSINWIILRWKIEILNRPQYNEIINIKTWVRNADRKFLYRDFEMCDKNGNKIVIGTSQWAIINIKTKEIINMCEEIKTAYEIESKNVFLNNKVKRILKPQNCTNKIKYKILKSDLDVNEHVHNLNYLNMAYEVLDKECSTYNNLEIEYKKEIKYNDKIEVIYSKEENKDIIEIKSEDSNITHAVINFY